MRDSQARATGDSEISHHLTQQMQRGNRLGYLPIAAVHAGHVSIAAVTRVQDDSTGQRRFDVRSSH